MSTHDLLGRCPKRGWRACRWLLALALVPAAWMVSARAARADNIDQGLFLAAPSILEDLHSHGYKNVGVLKFQVQKDNERSGSAKGVPSFAVGRLNTMMATRLENALIRHMNESNQIGITRGASAVAAAKNKASTYTTAAGRKELFTHKYPMVVGNKDAHVDAFLTGLVVVDFKTGLTTVVIRAFDKTSTTMREVKRIRENTDRSLLTDMNLNYSIVRREIKGTGGKKETKDVAYLKGKNGARIVLRGDQLPPEGDDDPKQADKPPVEPNNGGGDPPTSSVSFDSLLKFRAFYDDQYVETDPDGRLPPPRKDQKVHFLVQSTKRVGMVLRVNGVNTLNDEKDQRQVGDYSMWVLEPGREYIIRGFYPDRAKVRPFKVVNLDEVDKSEMGDETKWGQIDIDLFAETAPEGTPQERKVVLRGVTSGAKTLKEAQRQILQASKPRSRNIIAPSGNAETANIETATFRGGFAVRQTITYFSR
jgi:hypothetical protein